MIPRHLSATSTTWYLLLKLYFRIITDANYAIFILTGVYTNWQNIIR